MVVLGVTGKLQTQLSQSARFLVQYSVNFDPEARYSVHMAIGAEETGCGREEMVEVLQNNLSDPSEERDYFKRRIDLLTQETARLGVEQAIRAFMTARNF